MLGGTHNGAPHTKEYTLASSDSIPSHWLISPLSQSHYHADPPQRGPDGRYQPAEQILPLDEQFIGGFHPSTPAQHGQHGLHPTGRVDGHPPPSPRPSEGTAETSTRTSQLTHLSAVERSQALRVARMQPHLQFMVGPLLRYDIVDERGIWNGAALVVSKYETARYSCTILFLICWNSGRFRFNIRATSYADI
jgi:hypothetical protein